VALSVRVMHANLNRKVVVGVAVIAACAVGGGAYAATTDNGDSSGQAFLNDAASRAGVSHQRLKDALAGALQDQLNAAVKAGKLTQAQANAIVQRFRQGGGLPFGPGPLGGGPHVQRFGVRGGPLGAAASYLGLSVPQLFDQLRGGKSLAQVAGSRHKSTSGLENAIVADERTRLDKARAAGMITSAQEQQELSRLQSRIKSLVNQTGGFGGRGGLHRFGGRLPALPGGQVPGPPTGGLPGPPPGTDLPQPPGLPATPY
jgi:hypothetical protein